MVLDVIVTLFVNVMLLLSMSFIMQLLPKTNKKLYNSLIIGAYTSIVALVIMSSELTFEFYPGMIFDTRSVLISSTGMFFGAIPTAMTWITMIGYRYSIGGSGMFTAFINISQAAMIGLLFRRFRMQNKKIITTKLWEFVSVSYVVHIIMFLLVFTLPAEDRNAIMPHLWYMVLLFLPISGIGINAFYKYHINLGAKKENILEYRELFENSHVALMLLDPDTGKILDVNKTCIEFYGWTYDELTDMYIHDINTLSKEEIDKEIQLCNELKKDHFDFKHRLKSGTVLDVEVHSGPVIFQNRQVLLSTIIDSTEKIRNRELLLEKQTHLEYIGYHDHLTGLFNRGFFEAELKRLHTERQLPLSIIFGDVNGLKNINDESTHLDGDKLLIEVANIIKDSVRSEDVVARWGGDEFVILLPQTNEHIVKEIINRINRSCKKSRSKYKPSISLGYTTSHVLTKDMNTPLRFAEKMMYKNKRTRKN